MFMEPLQDDTCFIYITSQKLISFLTQVLLPLIYRMKELRLGVVAKLVLGHTMGGAIFKSSTVRLQSLGSLVHTILQLCSFVWCNLHTYTHMYMHTAKHRDGHFNRFYLKSKWIKICTNS